MHKYTFLLPDADDARSVTSLTEKITKVVSFWHEGAEYTFNGKRKRTTGSIFQDFNAVRSAIEALNREHTKLKVRWFVYGLPVVAEDLDKTPSEDSLSVVYEKTPNDIEDMFENCSLFIVPDAYEDHNKIFALSAMIRRIPTLVPSTSCIGVFLNSSNEAAVDKAIVTLSNDSNLNNNVDLWKQKIAKVYDKYEKALEGAQVICNMLKDSQELYFPELYEGKKAVVLKTYENSQGILIDRWKRTASKGSTRSKESGDSGFTLKEVTVFSNSRN